MRKHLAMIGMAALLVSCGGDSYEDAVALLEDLVACDHEPAPATGDEDSAMCQTEEGGVLGHIASDESEAKSWIRTFLDVSDELVVWDGDSIYLLVPTERTAEAVADRLGGHIIRTPSDLES